MKNQGIPARINSNFIADEGVSDPTTAQVSLSCIHENDILYIAFLGTLSKDDFSYWVRSGINKKAANLVFTRHSSPIVGIVKKKFVRHLRMTMTPNWCGISQLS